MKSWNDNFDQFVNSIACFVVLTQNLSGGCTFILNNELWNKFLLGHVRIVWEDLQKLVHSSGVSILDPDLTDTLFVRWNVQNIYLAQKSYCAVHVVFWALLL